MKVVDYTNPPPRWNNPLVRLDKQSKRFRCDVYAKLELVNPTGVHKDRESVVVVDDAKKKGFTALACASSGNAAISISAFAYINNIQAHVFVARDTPQEKLALIEVFRPNIHKVKGDYLDAVDALKIFIEGKRIYNANAGYCPAKLVGNSFIGMEIAQEVQPDYVVCPTSNGTHFVGVAMGLREAGSKARMIAATAPKTKIAHSIKGFWHLEEPKITQAIQETNGEIIELSDNQIQGSTKDLARQGIIAEPAAAASVAALEYLSLEIGDTVSCTITGLGLKYPDLMGKMLSGE